MLFWLTAFFSGSKGPKNNKAQLAIKAHFKAPTSPPRILLKIESQTKETNFSNTFPSKRTRTTTTMNTTMKARKGTITPSS